MVFAVGCKLTPFFFSLGPQINDLGSPGHVSSILTAPNVPLKNHHISSLSPGPLKIRKSLPRVSKRHQNVTQISASGPHGFSMFFRMSSNPISHDFWNPFSIPSGARGAQKSRRECKRSIPKKNKQKKGGRAEPRKPPKRPPK